MRHISYSKLGTYISPDALCTDYDGNLEYHHDEWINRQLVSFTVLSSRYLTDVIALR